MEKWGDNIEVRYMQPGDPELEVGWILGFSGLPGEEGGQSPSLVMEAGRYDQEPITFEQLLEVLRRIVPDLEEREVDISPDVFAIEESRSDNPNPPGAT